MVCGKRDRALGRSTSQYYTIGGSVVLILVVLLLADVPVQADVGSCYTSVRVCAVSVPIGPCSRITSYCGGRRSLFNLLCTQ